MKIIAFVQARMSSTRLPGKVMKSVQGKPLLGILLERLKVSKYLTDIVIITSEDTTDDIIAHYCDYEGINCFRGSLHDVLDRYHQAAILYQADHIVRITSDCPLIDSVIVDQVIEEHIAKQNDYTCNVLPRTFPDGQDVQIINYKTLDKLASDAIESKYREHVLNYIHDHRDNFQYSNVSNSQDQSTIRMTVDYAEDFELIKKIVDALYEKNAHFTLDEIVRYISGEPA